jgi:putative two-component system response regulator
MNQTSRKTVLVIDDAAENLTLINGLLKDSYEVKVANNGERGLALARNRPDLILLDVMMSGVDGWEVCRRLKLQPETRDVPVIFLTGRVDADDERMGLELGAADYVTKPINPPVLRARVNTQMTLKESADLLRYQNLNLEGMVAKRTQEVLQIQDASLLALAALAETRDNETGNHIRRTQHYVRILAERLRANPRFSAILNQTYCEELFRSAPLHDIGKVGIPDHILLKPGKLSNEEFAIMKTHTTLGRQALESVERQLGIDLEFLRITKDIAYSHHERWDGRGYPRGLVGEEIPVAARLMSLADVYDALISTRVYKPAMSHNQALEVIAAERDKIFDPAVVDAFMSSQEDFRKIALRYSDA